MTQFVLVRHAEPLLATETPEGRWPLTDDGRNAARALGERLARPCATSTVWTSPERRASETAALAFPSLAIGVRDQLKEVTKPWYRSADEHAAAVASYLKGEAIEGWEHREDVVTRMGSLRLDAGSLERLVLVSHGLLLTTWLDHEIGLDDPFSFWSSLRMPDAWEIHLEERSLTRLA